MEEYIIKKINGPVTKESFSLANVATVNLCPWPKQYPITFHTEARILYTDDALYVNFKTDEKPLFAHQVARDMLVCQDSCMEFFFSPDADDIHYFNFEVNPIGTLRVSYATSRYDIQFLKEDSSEFDIESIITKDSWTLYYKIPFSVILNYSKKISDTMRGNLYKCGDYTPHVHFNCWNMVDPDFIEFHNPSRFGLFKFEKGAPVL